MEYFTLNNGIKIPMAGIGVFLMSPAEAETAVETALKSGVRLIDTANGYMNESGTCSCISLPIIGGKVTDRLKKRIKRAR